METLAQSSRLEYSFSGSGVNVTAALARYGHNGALITTLPETPVGEAAIAYLRKLGVDTSLIRRGGKHLGMYFLENGFGARPGRVTYTDRLGSSFNTAEADQYDMAALASRVDVLHLCGITLAMNDRVRGQMKQLAAEVKRAGAGWYSTVTTVRHYGARRGMLRPARITKSCLRLPIWC